MSFRTLSKLALIFLLCLSLVGCGELFSGGWVGQNAPELLSVRWVNQPPSKTLEGLRGKVVLLEFWATWCPPCRESAPHLNRLYRELGPQGLVILSISDEKLGVVERFVRDNGLQFAVGAESDNNVQYEVNSIPKAFLIDRNGKIAWEGHPMQAEWQMKAREMLAIN